MALFNTYFLNIISILVAHSSKISQKAVRIKELKYEERQIN